MQLEKKTFKKVHFYLFLFYLSTIFFTMSSKKPIIALFDVDGTLTASRKVCMNNRLF